MNPRLKKRLDAIEKKLSPDQSQYGVLFFPLDGETDEDYDLRIERWYAGEQVEGQERIYSGQEVRVIQVVAVRAGNRRTV